MVHGNKGQQRRQHQRCDNDQRRSHVPQEEEQHNDNQYNALKQHFGHGPQRGIDQFRAVVIRHNLETIRQHALGVNLVNPRLDLANHGFGIAAREHQDDTADRFCRAVLD